MTYLPGGDPHIPNQLPNPYGTPSLLAQQAEEPAPLVTTEQRQRAMTQLLLRLAMVGAVLMGGAVIVGFVAPGLDSPTNVIVVMAAAVVNGAIWVVALMRQLRRNGRSTLLSVADRPVVQDATEYGSSQTLGLHSSHVTDRIMDVPSYGTAAFHLTVEDVFSITGRGTVATGEVAAGTLSPGQVVSVVRLGTVIARSRVTAIEAFRRQVEVAQPGERIGVVLDGLSKTEVRKGDVLAGEGV